MSRACRLKSQIYFLFLLTSAVIAVVFEDPGGVLHEPGLLVVECPGDALSIASPPTSALPFLAERSKRLNSGRSRMLTSEPPTTRCTQGNSKTKQICQVSSVKGELSGNLVGQSGLLRLLVPHCRLEGGGMARRTERIRK